jgi:hypothetical protein
MHRYSDLHLTCTWNRLACHVLLHCSRHVCRLYLSAFCVHANKYQPNDCIRSGT